MLLIFTDLWSPFLIRVIPACYPQAIARQTGLFRQLTQPFPHAPLIRTMIQRIVTVIHRSVVIRLNQCYQCAITTHLPILLPLIHIPSFVFVLSE